MQNILWFVNPRDGKCLCLDRYYQPNGSSSCVKCHSSCLSCKGTTASDCLTCSLDKDNRQANSLGKCLCIPGYFEDQILLKCVECYITCATCSGFATNCVHLIIQFELLFHFKYFILKIQFLQCFWTLWNVTNVRLILLDILHLIKRNSTSLLVWYYQRILDGWKYVHSM